MSEVHLDDDFLLRHRGDTSAIHELERLLERECFAGSGHFVHSERCTRIRYALEVIAAAPSVSAPAADREMAAPESHREDVPSSRVATAEAVVGTSILAPLPGAACTCQRNRTRFFWTPESECPEHRAAPVAPGPQTPEKS